MPQGVGLRGRIASVRIAQIYQPGGVPAKISGRQGINPDRNQSLENFPIPPCPTQLRPAVAGLRRAGRTGNSFRRRRYLEGSQGNGGPIPPCPNASQDRVSVLRDANNGWASTYPNKLDVLCNPRVQALLNGTTQCGRFQQFSMGMIVGKRDLNFRL